MNQARINPAIYSAPIHVRNWLEANADQFLPPVMNKLMYTDPSCQWKVMFVGGPNSRTDYHIEEGEEWFYQLKGDMVLKIVDGGQFKDVLIREGECYLHPARIPHSPQRFENTVGLVMERLRTNDEADGLRWYCPNPKCRRVLFEKFFVCENLGTQLSVLIDQYYSDELLRTCKHCGTVEEIPQKFLQRIAARKAQQAKNKVIEEKVAIKMLPTPAWAFETPVVDSARFPPPFSLQSWLRTNAASLLPPVGNKLISHPSAQFKIMAVGGPNARTDYHVNMGEEWFWQLQGDLVLKVIDGGHFRDITVRAGECFLLPGGVPHSPQRPANSIGIVLERERFAHEQDAMIWYCQQCKSMLHKEIFHCYDLGTQLKPVIERYASDVTLRTCRKCNTVDEAPALAAALNPKISKL